MKSRYGMIVFVTAQFPILAEVLDEVTTDEVPPGRILFYFLRVFALCTLYIVCSVAALLCSVQLRSIAGLEGCMWT